MTVSKCVAQCDTNSICTKKEVLKYLYIQAEKANYLAKDTVNFQLLIRSNSTIIEYKDSLISNRNEALRQCENANEINEIQITSLEKSNKTLTRKASVFKFTTISVAILGSITTILALFK